MENINKDLLLARIEELCNERNINRTTAFKESGVGKNFKSNLSTSNPSMGKITMLANYFGVPVEYLTGESDETEQYPRIKANLSELFDQNNNLTRYACHLWEALNEIITSHLLLGDVLNGKYSSRSSDFFLVFKQCVAAICESAKLLALFEVDNDITVFREVKEHYLQDPNINSAYITFETAWEKNVKFFRAFRNHFMHFDHERKKLFAQYISKTKEHIFCDYKGNLCDFNDTISEDVMIEIYKTSYNIKDQSKDVLLNKCIDTIKEMLFVTTSTLQVITRFFFVNYSVYQIFSDKDQILTTKESIPYFAYTSPKKSKAFNITDAEKELISSYRNHPELQEAVKRILLPNINESAQIGKKKAADNVDDLATNPKYKSDEKIKLYPEAAFDRSRTVEEGSYTEEQLHEINDPKNRAEIDSF